MQAQAVPSQHQQQPPGVRLGASLYPREADMDLPDALEQLSNATHSMKLFVSWLESQTEEQIREISGGDWLALTSAIHDLEERAIELDRGFTRGKEARPT